MTPRRWDVLAQMLNEDGFTSFVEVGCKEGRTTGHVLAHCPNVHVTAIDPWRPMLEQKDVKGGETYEQWDFGAIEDAFWQNVGEHRDRVAMLRQTSLEAAAHVEPADLVFIDGAHDYDSVVTDISTWLQKVRPGGILAGHDFNHKWPSVHRAVADSFNLMRVMIAPDSVWWVRCA